MAQLGLFSCLVDVLLTLRNANLVEYPLPHILIEELFDIQTINWCQLFWPYLNSRIHYLTENLAGNKAPGTTLIRLCNALLRRLSKTQHAHFSGEIAMYLAKAFPLTEKSGLNIRGAFNVDNITYYEGDGRQSEYEKRKNTEKENNESGSSEKNGDDAEETNKTEQQNNDNGDVEMIDADEENEKNAKDQSGQSKNEMYERFWSLQDVFRDPTVLFDNTEMTKFKDTAKTVVTELKRCESQYNTQHDRDNERRLQEIDLSDDEDDNSNESSNDPNEKASTSRVGSMPPGAEEDISAMLNNVLFVPKWLTRRDLFELQLKDASFRRAVLTQMCILIEFLVSLDAKSKSSKNWQLATNKGLLATLNYTLDPSNTMFFTDLRKSIRQSSNRESDFQISYTRSVDSVLFRDSFWQSWKLRNCPSFGLEPITKDSTEIATKANPYPTKKKTAAAAAASNGQKENGHANALSKKNTVYEDAIEKLDRLQKPRPKYAHAMGTIQLSKVWNIPIGVEHLRKRGSLEIRCAEEYQKEIEEDELEFKNNYQYEMEVTDDEEDGSAQEVDEDGNVKEKEKKRKTIIKMLASREEERAYHEKHGSKTWRGLRAARSQGLWSDFGKITKDSGLGGLFAKEGENGSTSAATNNQVNEEKTNPDDKGDVSGEDDKEQPDSLAPSSSGGDSDGESELLKRSFSERAEEKDGQEDEDDDEPKAKKTKLDHTEQNEDASSPEQKEEEDDGEIIDVEAETEKARAKAGLSPIEISDEV